MKKILIALTCMLSLSAFSQAFKREYVHCFLMHDSMPGYGYNIVIKKISNKKYQAVILNESGLFKKGFYSEPIDLARTVNSNGTETLTSINGGRVDLTLFRDDYSGSLMGKESRGTTMLCDPRNEDQIRKWNINDSYDNTNLYILINTK